MAVWPTTLFCKSINGRQIGKISCSNCSEQFVFHNLQNCMYFFYFKVKSMIKQKIINKSLSVPCMDITTCILPFYNVTICKSIRSTAVALWIFSCFFFSFLEEGKKGTRTTTFSLKTFYLHWFMPHVCRFDSIMRRRALMSMRTDKGWGFN